MYISAQMMLRTFTHTVRGIAIDELNGLLRLWGGTSHE